MTTDERDKMLLDHCANAGDWLPQAACLERVGYYAIPDRPYITVGDFRAAYTPVLIALAGLMLAIGTIVAILWIVQ